MLIIIININLKLYNLLFLIFFLKDELETTKRSYEEQLRTLTDHLCGMNEKLTLQKDEIDTLKSGALLDKKNKSKWKN